METEERGKTYLTSSRILARLHDKKHRHHSTAIADSLDHRFRETVGPIAPGALLPKSQPISRFHHGRRARSSVSFHL
jgi:hypothetical protein